jgi:uncharacterized protein (DUF1499 family)
VSSDAPDSAHSIAPFQLSVPAGDAWRVLRATLENSPRTKIVTASEDYLHAECSSAVFGFVDDLELHLRSPQNTIAVRSASRLGYGDFGVNRKRVEALRQQLQKKGVVR